jgi:hypothetical protein
MELKERISEITERNRKIGYRVALDRTTIGFIARGTERDGHSPKLKEQHGDCIIPIDGVIGFSYRPGGRPASEGALAAGSAFFDMNLNGAVTTTAILEAHARNSMVQWEQRLLARMLIEATYAKEKDYPAAVLLIQAPERNVSLFIEKWQELRNNPKAFHIIGGNCSTRAKEIFVASNIIPNKLFFPDTPNKLFHFLKDYLSSAPGYKTETFFGYVGFEKKTSRYALGYDLVVLTS